MPLYIHRSGEFGWEDFLEPVVHNITDGGDFYLVANDFVPYLEAQVKRQKRGDWHKCSKFINYDELERIENAAWIEI